MRSNGATHVGLDTTHPALHLVNLYSGWGFQHRETIQWPGKDYASVVMILELAPTR
ncbi:MAG: family N-acetyltransferase [Leifsonia sp.]|nr:family N-acetyltransferase [Leifsonia sp.]